MSITAVAGAVLPLFPMAQLGSIEDIRTDTMAAVEACVPVDERDRSIDSMTIEERRAMIGCVFRQTAAQMNPQLPARVDEITIMERMSVSGATLTYHSRVEVDVAEVSRDGIAALEKATRAYVCNEQSMRSTIGMGGSYRYVWVDASGQPLHSALVEAC